MTHRLNKNHRSKIYNSPSIATLPHRIVIPITGPCFVLFDSAVLQMQTIYKESSSLRCYDMYDLCMMYADASMWLI